ncbi:lytic transglycosylase domain-containing protein [Salibacterium aidingense]|uniref:lytic transglycosylase domain-containing protein n=1 Tax=Salibacterium aidingense TaxID=384933 RepID=UPI003BDFC820
MNSISLRWTGLLLPVLLLLSAFDKSHIEELEGKSEELEHAIDFEEKMPFLQESEQLTWDAGYHEWTDARQEAAVLREESGDKFPLDWGTYMVYQAKKKEISPALVYELLHVETGGTFDPTLTGPPTEYGRAYGLGQFMKNTGPWIADLSGLPYRDSLLFDPYYSIQLSIEYLDYLHDKYNDWDQALTAYHRGVGGLEAYKSRHGNAESWYAEEIQKKADKKEELLAAE